MEVVEVEVVTVSISRSHNAGAYRLCSSTRRRNSSNRTNRLTKNRQGWETYVLEFDTESRLPPTSVQDKCLAFRFTSPRAYSMQPFDAGSCPFRTFSRRLLRYYWSLVNLNTIQILVPQRLTVHFASTTSSSFKYCEHHNLTIRLRILQRPTAAIRLPR